MSEAFVWFHNSSDNPNETSRFYEKLLDWKASDGLSVVRDPGGAAIALWQKA
jgi:hypothetical protein